MASRDRGSSSLSPLLRARGSSKYPKCPSCERRMTVKQVMPVLFTRELDEVIYRCEDCDTETKRTVKRR